MPHAGTYCYQSDQNALARLYGYRTAEIMIAREYHRTTTGELARRLGVSVNCIGVRINLIGIPRKNRGGRNNKPVNPTETFTVTCRICGEDLPKHTDRIALKLALREHCAPHQKTKKYRFRCDRCGEYLPATSRTGLAKLMAAHRCNPLMEQFEDGWKHACTTVRP